MRAQAWSDAHDQLAAALALWRGPAFADVASRWIQDSEVFPLTELRLQACEWRIEVDLQLGRGAELVGELQLLVHQHPLREQFWAQLMLALYRAGRQGDSLAAYAQVRRLLHDERGVDSRPGPDRSTPAGPRRRCRPGRHRSGRCGRRSAGRLDGQTGASPVRHPRIQRARGRTRRTRRHRRRAHRTRDHRGVGAGRCRQDRVGGPLGAPRPAPLPGRSALSQPARSPQAPPLPLIDALARFLPALGVPAEQVPADPDQAADLYRSLLADRRMLMVLDNAATPTRSGRCCPAAPAAWCWSPAATSWTVWSPGTAPTGSALDVLPPAEARRPARPAARRRPGRGRAGGRGRARAAVRLPAAGAAGRRGQRWPPRRPADRRRTSSGCARQPAGGPRGGRRPAGGVRVAFDLSYRALPAPARRLFRLLGLLPART